MANNLDRVSIVSWVAAVAILSAPALLAQTASHYANARKYLKTAENLMQAPPARDAQLKLTPAAKQVGAAIADLDRGAHTGPGDGTEDLGADASQMPAVPRIRSIVDLLNSAQHEILQDTTGLTKSGGPTQEWRNNALRHVAAALDSVHRAATAAHLDRQVGSF